MLNLPQKTLAKVRDLLLRRQKEVDQQLKSLEKSDPVLLDGVAEASESGTESWLADTHRRLTAGKNDLLDFSSRITSSLLRIKKGTYGKCERCKIAIETERLKVMPMATLCLACSQKFVNSKKR